MDMIDVYFLGVATGVVLAGSIPILVYLGIISPKIMPGSPDYKAPEGGIFGNKESGVKDV